MMNTIFQAVAKEKIQAIMYRHFQPDQQMRTENKFAVQREHGVPLFTRNFGCSGCYVKVLRSRSFVKRGCLIKDSRKKIF